MNKMATSIIAGSLIGVGVWALSDQRSRNNMLRSGNKMMKKFTNM